MPGVFRVLCEEHFRISCNERNRKSRAKKHGLTPEQVDEIFEKQGRVCAICSSSEPFGKGYWHLDHCHVTGKVRGFLCHYCNTALGSFDDSIDVLKKAIEYLEMNSGKMKNDSDNKVKG